MNTLKKYLGIAWIILAAAAIIYLVATAVYNIQPDGKLDINKPLPWIIIIVVFTPIAAGLALFGWYALKGEYDRKK